MNVFASLSGLGPGSAAALLGASAGPGLTYTELVDFSKYDDIVVMADLVGGAGGTMQVGLQCSPDGLEWLDWLRFPDVLTGQASIKYRWSQQPTSGIAITGGSPSAWTIAANTAVGGHPGSAVRVLFVGQAGVATPILQKIRVSGSLRNLR